MLRLPNERLNCFSGDCIKICDFHPPYKDDKLQALEKGKDLLRGIGMLG